MSVRLTASFDAQHKALVDSIAQILKSAAISVEVSHDMMNGRNAAVTHAHRNTNSQADGVSTLIVPDCGKALKRDDRSPVIHRDGLYSAIAGNLV